MTEAKKLSNNFETARLDAAGRPVRVIECSSQAERAGYQDAVDRANSCEGYQRTVLEVRKPEVFSIH